MVRKAQGESTPKQLETGTRPLSRFPHEEQIVSQLHLPSRALGWMVPLGKNNLADRVDPSLFPGGLWKAGRSGKREPRGYPALRTKRCPVSAPHTAWVSRDVTSWLWEEAHLSPWSCRCGPGTVTCDTCFKCSRTEGNRVCSACLSPFQDCVQLALVGQ